jgi:hypothetical protein
MVCTSMSAKQGYVHVSCVRLVTVCESVMKVRVLLVEGFPMCWFSVYVCYVNVLFVCRYIQYVGLLVCYTVCVCFC